MLCMYTKNNSNLMKQKAKKQGAESRKQKVQEDYSCGEMTEEAEASI